MILHEVIGLQNPDISIMLNNSLKSKVLGRELPHYEVAGEYTAKKKVQKLTYGEHAVIKESYSEDGLFKFMTVTHAHKPMPFLYYVLESEIPFPRAKESPANEELDPSQLIQLIAAQKTIEFMEVINNIGTEE